MQPLFSALVVLVALLCYGIPQADAAERGTNSPGYGSVFNVSLEDSSGNSIMSGGGFVIDQSGALVTNCQLIGKWLQDIDSSLVATAGDGREYSIAEVTSYNCRQNLVVVKLSVKALPAVRLNTSYHPKRGDQVALVHNPRGDKIETARGSVNAVGGPGEQFEISVPQTEKSAGSPVINAKGEVIGMATFLMRKGRRHYVVIPAFHIEKHLQYYKDAMARARLGLPEYPADSVTPDRQRRLARAIEWARTHPQDFGAHIELGTAYSDTGHHREAAEAFLDAVRLDSGNPEGYTYLGLAYYRSGRYFEAADAYRQASQLRPDRKDLYHKLGTVYILLGEYDMAIDTFRKVISMEPQDAAAHFHMGISYYLKGDRVGAADEYAALKELDKERAATLHELLYE
jgi:Flp pilus assembly protein TadD